MAFVVSFAMLAMFFFLALYMQNTLGYSAVEAGVRFLPSTLMIVLIAPLAGRLSDRVGPRPLMVTGLSLSAFALFLQTRIGVHTGYELLLPSFMIMGVGMALTMSPDVHRRDELGNAEKAGAASGILSMSRMVGGTFGVAAIGALFQHLARARLEDSLSGLPVTSAQREHLVENLGSGSGGPSRRARPGAGREGGHGIEGRLHPRPRERHVAVHRRGRHGRRPGVLARGAEAGRAPGAGADGGRRGAAGGLGTPPPVRSRRSAEAAGSTGGAPM